MEPFSKSIQKRIEHQTGEKLFTQAEVNAKIASAEEATVEKCANIEWLVIGKKLSALLKGRGINIHPKEFQKWLEIQVGNAIRALVKTPGNLAQRDQQAADEKQRMAQIRLSIEYLVKKWTPLPDALMEYDGDNHGDTAEAASNRAWKCAAEELESTFKTLHGGIK